MRKITINEMIGACDVWMNRAQILAEYWRDESNPAERRARAFGLWQVLFQRLSKATKVYADFKMAQNSKVAMKFPNGGINIIRDLNQRHNKPTT